VRDHVSSCAESSTGTRSSGSGWASITLPRVVRPMTWAVGAGDTNAELAATRCPLTAGNGVRVVARRKLAFPVDLGLASAACKWAVSRSARRPPESWPALRALAAKAWPRFDFTIPAGAPRPGSVSPYVCANDRQPVRSRAWCRCHALRPSRLVGTDPASAMARRNKLTGAGSSARSDRRCGVWLVAAAANFGKDVRPSRSAADFRCSKRWRPLRQTVPLAARCKRGSGRRRTGRAGSRTHEDPGAST